MYHKIGYHIYADTTQLHRSITNEGNISILKQRFLFISSYTGSQ